MGPADHPNHPDHTEPTNAVNLTRGGPPARGLAEPGPAQEQEVTKLELFFDLVYVFAISQLSEHLLEHLTWRGALETLVLSMTVFVVWSFTTYESTMVLARRYAARRVILAVMVAGLVMNASITHAFEDSPWTFVVPMLAIQVGRSAMTRRYDVYPQLRAHRVSMIIWQGGSAVPWLLGALASPEHRLWWWAAALAVDLLGMWSHHPVPGRTRVGDDAGLGFDVAHQLERCRLFLLICLGEGILTTGNAMIHGLHHPLGLLSGILAMLVIIGIWYVFFGVGAEDVDAFLLMGRSGPARRSDLALGHLITNGQQVLVVGLVAFAVGTEVIVAAPGAPMPAGAVLAQFGGVVVCVTAFWVFQGMVSGRWRWPSLLGADLALLLAGGVVVATGAPGIVAICVMVAVMAGLGLAYRRDVEASRGAPRAAS